MKGNIMRYYVTSRQDYIVNGTKDTGYATYRAAVNARNRVDERDSKNGKTFSPMKIVLSS